MQTLWIAGATPLLTTLLVATPFEGRTQGIAPIRCAFDTARATRPSRLYLGLAPVGPDLNPAAGVDEVLWMADAIATHFKPPARVGFPLWARIAGAGPFLAPTGHTAPLYHGLEALFELTFDADGRLRDRDSVRIATASSDLNASLRHAILAADSARAIPALSDSLRQAGGRVRFRIVNMVGAKVTSVALMHVIVPVIRATTPARIISIPPAVYPRTVASSINDSLEVEYLVDADGRIEASRIWPIRSRYVEFFQAAVESIGKGTFEPARVEGCAVPALVRQRLHFQTSR